MKLFGWKGAASPRPPLLHARPMCGVIGGGAGEDWPGDYIALLRAGVCRNPIAQRAMRLVAEGAGSAALTGRAGDVRIAARAVRLVGRTTGGQALVETLAMYLLLHGNAYVEIAVDEAGEPLDLYALRPDRVTAETDRNGWPVAYLYRAGERRMRLASEDGAGRTAIIHLKSINPLDDHYGMGCAQAAAGAVAIHNAATRWNKALLENAARPSGAIVHDAGRDGAPLSAEQFARLKAELESAFQGADNAGRPMLLEGGLKWQALSLSPADMDFIALKAAAARDIALAFGVPPMLLGLPGDSTFANYREANRALWRQTILPLLAKIVGSLEQGLATHWPGLALAIDREAVPELADEQEGLWDRISTAGFLTDEEKRVLLGVDRLTARARGAAEKEMVR